MTRARLTFSALALMLSTYVTPSVANASAPVGATSDTGDVGGRPVTLVPDGPISPSSGPTTQQVVPAGRSYRCQEAGTLRRREKSYVMGWCTVGMHFDASDARHPQGYQPGWGEGSYQHCGWFEAARHTLVQDGSFDHNCGTTRYPENHFANAINRSPANDGHQVAVLRECGRYLNVQPWSSSATDGMDQVGTILPSDRFFWRYKTKNNRWVLGRMERPGTAAYYDWIFVDKDCVGTPPTRPPSSR